MNEEVQLQIVRCSGCGEFLQEGTTRLRFHDSSCRARFWRRKHLVNFHSELIQRYIAEWLSGDDGDQDYRDAVAHAIQEILLTIGYSRVQQWVDEGTVNLP